MFRYQVCPNNYTKVLCLIFFLLPPLAFGMSTCDNEASKESSRSESLKFKLAAIASILVAGGIGVSLPQLGRRIKALNPDNDIFFMIKAFAAGVILATGFVHILPDAFDSLSSPCLKENPWGKFPFAGFVAMMSSIGTLMIDSLASGFYTRSHFKKSKQLIVDEEKVGDDEHSGHVHIHTHGTHGHAHGSVVPSEEQKTGDPDLLRHRIVSQVLELGVIIHSIVIGITLGASQSPETIKTLLAALSFHQFFEGLGLGGCISQGIFNSASAGILIYMALVDLLAADFMDPKMQSNIRLQLAANLSLLLGAGCINRPPSPLALIGSFQKFSKGTKAFIG